MIEVTMAVVRPHIKDAGMLAIPCDSTATAQKVVVEYIAQIIDSIIWDQEDDLDHYKECVDNDELGEAMEVLSMCQNVHIEIFECPIQTSE